MMKQINLNKLNYQRGFTIVELLIVIVVIGILAALVLNTFSGVQARARDTERDTDVKALSTQLEALFNEKGNGSYPNTYADATSSGSTGGKVNLLNDADVIAKLKGLDLNSLRVPNQLTNSIVFSLAPGSVAPTVGATTSSTALTNVASTSGYLYQPLTAADAICNTEGLICTKANIFYVREAASTAVVSKISLSQ